MTSPDRRKSAAKAPPARRYRRETAAGARRYRRETAARPPRDRRETATLPPHDATKQVISSGLRISREYFRLSRAAQDNLAPRLSRRGSRLSRAFQVKPYISRPPRVISSRQVNGYLERAHSGYLERSGYLEGGVGATWASRWLGPFRMTLDSVRSGDDSVRTSDTRETRHPTFPASTQHSV